MTFKTTLPRTAGKPGKRSDPEAANAPGETYTDVPGWWRNEDTRQQIEQEIMRALIGEGEMELAKQDFQEEALQYIIATGRE
jgi:hypothetical protein